jgi:hypothetical protein
MDHVAAATMFFVDLIALGSLYYMIAFWGVI